MPQDNINLKNYSTVQDFDFDTQPIYRTLVQNKNIITAELLQEFKDRVNEYVQSTDGLEAELPFTKENWKYVKDKFESENSNSNYFCKRTPLEESMFTKNEYLQRELQSPMYKLIGPKYAVLRKTFKEKSKNVVFEDGPHWWNNAYDIFTFDQSIPLKKDFENSDIQYFFAWFWSFLDPLCINQNFISSILIEGDFTFEKFIAFLQGLAIKYGDVSIYGNWEKKLDLLKQLKIEPKISDILEENTLKPKIKGRPKNEFLIAKQISRTKNDKQTILNYNQTAIFFNFLREKKIILPLKRQLSDDNLSKNLACLTGYNPHEIRRVLSNRKLNYEEKKKLFELLTEICSALSRDMKDKNN